MRRTITRLPRELQLGDVIADGSKTGVKVNKIAHYACSKRDTHVNENQCYPWSIPVQIFS